MKTILLRFRAKRRPDGTVPVPKDIKGHHIVSAENIGTSFELLLNGAAVRGEARRVIESIYGVKVPFQVGCAPDSNYVRLDPDLARWDVRIADGYMPTVTMAFGDTVEALS